MSNLSTSVLLTSIAEAVSLFAPGYTGWAIYGSGSTSQAIIPDSFAMIEMRDESSIADYPMEQGAFASYNKVEIPFDVRVRVTCNGNGSMSRSDFLTQLRYMKQTTDLYDVATPDAYYAGLSMVHYDYARTADHGAQLITAELWFQEIRQTPEATYSTSDPSLYGVQSNSASAASPQQRGTVTATFPSDAEVAAGQAQGYF